MLRIRSHVGVLFFLVVIALVVGCAGGSEDAEQATRDQDWAALQAEHQALTEARGQLADLRMQWLDAQVTEGEEGEEPAAAVDEAMEEGVEEGASEEGASEEGATEEPMTAEAIKDQIDQLESQVTTMSETFGMKLVEYINADPVYQGEEPNERQKAAFRLKSGEDILLAQEYIDKGGDYRRAIEIFEAALMIDADNPELIAALEKAKAERFMTEERFAQVSQGMGEGQVKALLGQVYHHNVREYPEKDVKAWFFPKEEGGAAGVYFQLHKKSETYQVYRVDFDAVKPPTEEGGEGEESDPEIP